jgi:hypothetical protein
MPLLITYPPDQEFFYGRHDTPSELTLAIIPASESWLKALRSAGKLAVFDPTIGAPEIPKQLIRRSEELLKERGVSNGAQNSDALSEQIKIRWERRFKFYAGNEALRNAERALLSDELNSENIGIRHIAAFILTFDFFVGQESNHHRLAQRIANFMETAATTDLLTLETVKQNLKKASWLTMRALEPFIIYKQWLSSLSVWFLEPEITTAVLAAAYASSQAISKHLLAAERFLNIDSLLSHNSKSDLKEAIKPLLEQTKGRVAAFIENLERVNPGPLAMPALPTAA